MVNNRTFAESKEYKILDVFQISIDLDLSGADDVDLVSQLVLFQHDFSLIKVDLRE